ncbi:hypothetical protein Tco_0481373, partial [Tanacetum coccineum]
MGRDTIQLEDAVSTISQEYLQEFASKYYIPESLHPELPGPEDNIVDFPKSKIGAAKVSHFEINCRVLNIRPTNYRFFWVDERVFPTVVDCRISAPKDERPAADSNSAKDVATLNLHLTPIQKQPEELLCLVGLSRNYFLRDDEYPTFLYDDDREMDLFNMINAPKSPQSEDRGSSSKKAAAAEDLGSKKSISFTSMGGPPEDIYQPGWGVTNNCLLDTPEVCQDMVDHIVPPGYFSVLRHLLNDDFLGQYNVNLTRQVAMGSHMRLRNWIKAAFQEFKKYEDDQVTSRCAKMDARLDALSIDFDKELYPHMLTAIAGRRWVIGHSLRLAVMKCTKSIELRHVFANVVSAGIAKGISEGLKHGVEYGKAKLDLAAIEAYDLEADDKFTMAFQAIKDLEYPLVDQLERLKDAPIDLIMASLYLESDTGVDAPQF